MLLRTLKLSLSGAERGLDPSALEMLAADQDLVVPCCYFPSCWLLFPFELLPAPLH